MTKKTIGTILVEWELSEWETLIDYQNTYGDESPITKKQLAKWAILFSIIKGLRKGE